MPKQMRKSTDYCGVYFVELADEDHSFFIRYKRNGKSFEERAGRSSQGWNAEKASYLRKERITGVNPKVSYLSYSKEQFDESNTWTFSSIFKAYLSLRPDLKGRENDIYRFKNYLKEDFGNVQPSELVPNDIGNFMSKLQNQKLKPATVRHILELLRRLANYALKKKFCHGLSFKIQMPTVENQKTENLSEEQLEKLLLVLNDESDKQVSNIVRLALYTGLRRGKIFNLKWNDVDFYGKTLTIKSKKKENTILLPMNEMAEKVLAEHAHSDVKSEFVFPGRLGKKRTECKLPLLRIKKKAGLPDDFRLLQGLRHVYASKLASSGKVDMGTLQTLLTHKSPLMTQRYAHLRENALKNIHKKMEQNEISFKNEKLENGLTSNNELFHEHKTEYPYLDVDPKIMEVDIDEILSAEELTEASQDEQNNEFTVHTKDDYTKGIFKENDKSEDGLTSNNELFHEHKTEYPYLDVDPKIMEVDIDEILSAEELTEVSQEELSGYNKISENKESDFLEELIEESTDFEDNMKVETEEVDCQNYSDKNLLPDHYKGDEVFFDDSISLGEAESEVEACEKEIKVSIPFSTNHKNNAKISKNTDLVNHSQKSYKNKVYVSKTHQNSERINSLKDLKIDLELTSEKKTSLLNSNNSTRASITDLKKELMSLSDLIKSTPVKVKSSAEVRNS